jgi:predicted aspartyl protease
MIIHTFDKKEPLVMVEVTVKVNGKINVFDFALDTGATITLVSDDALKRMGYTIKDSIGKAQTLTASKSETVYEYELDNIMAIGLIRRNFKVISRSLPIRLGIDGLLGLNFFKHKELTIDFKLSEIRLS